MKTITNLFKHLQAFSFLIGMIFGAALGLVLFSYLVPHGPKAIAMLRHYSSYKQQLDNKRDFQKVYASSTRDMHMNHSGQATDNPYMMKSITSEREFLEQMKLHHESAVTMAQQVLGVKGIHQEVKKLANDIIIAQTNEIQMIMNWLAIWK